MSERRADDLGAQDDCLSRALLALRALGQVAQRQEANYATQQSFDPLDEWYVAGLLADAAAGAAG